MNEVALRSIVLTWDPQTRVARLRFLGETRATEADALALVDAMQKWVGKESRPFALLGDGANLAGLDAGYRATWGAFYKEHRAHAFLAFYNMGPVVRIAAEMFRVGTGVQMKAFVKEDDARAWLRAKGIAA